MNFREAQSIIVRQVQDLNPLQYQPEGSDVPIADRLAGLETRFQAEADLSPFRTSRAVEVCTRMAEHFRVTPQEVLGMIPVGTDKANEVLPPDLEELVRKLGNFPFEQLQD